jgi:hypothetical protein
MSANTCVGAQTSWTQTFYCIDPYNFAYTGIALGMGVSIAGAAW